MKVRRETQEKTISDSAGGEIKLESRTWSAVVGTRSFGCGASYRTPRRVEVVGADGSGVTLHDHLMLVNLAVLALTLLAVAVRRISS